MWPSRGRSKKSHEYNYLIIPIITGFIFVHEVDKTLWQSTKNYGLLSILALPWNLIVHFYYVSLCLRNVAYFTLHCQKCHIVLYPKANENFLATSCPSGIATDLRQTTGEGNVSSIVTASAILHLSSSLH